MLSPEVTRLSKGWSRPRPGHTHTPPSVILTRWVISFIMGQFLSIYLKVHHLVSIFTMAVESVTQGYESSTPSWWVDRPASMQDTVVFLLGKWKHPLKPLKSFDRKSLHACLVSPSHCERGNQGAQTAGVAHYCCYRFRYSNMCLVWYEKKVTLCILIAALATCIVMPIFPKPDWFLQEKEGKKKRPFTNTLGLTAKLVHSLPIHKNIGES